jgi:GT2 family glycosyltransferase
LAFDFLLLIFYFETMFPLVSIIALNYNNTAVTVEFLRSIREHCRYPAIEVIVVDNGSADDPSRACKAAYPEVKMVLTGANLGFSAGNNAGIKAANGDFFFIVNNDTEFTPGLIEGLLELFQAYPDAGMACPKFQYYFHQGTIEWAGFRKLNVFTGRNTAIGHGEKDEGQHDRVHETPYAHGGGMMVPRSVVDKVGMMPEEFFLYYEELDWSEQIRRKGYKIYYQPASMIYHKESMTTGRASPLKTYYQTRNRILFMKRNVAWYQFLVFILFFIFLTIPKNTLKFIVKGQIQHLKAFWKGTLWHIFPGITF